MGDPNVRFYLFYGPDEAGSRSLADQLLQKLAAEKSSVEGAVLKSDPARLADDAAAISMFGGKQLIWIEPCGDEITDAVLALLEAPKGEHLVVAVAGGLRRNGRLLKAVESHPETLVHASYEPEDRALDDLIETMAAAENLRPDPGVTTRIACTTGSNRAIAAQELAKYALYLDASPERPASLSHEAVDAIGAVLAEDRFFALGDAAMAGDIEALETGLAAVSENGSEAVTVIRAMQRRIMQIAPMAARVAAGENASGVMTSMGKSLFWKDKPLVQKLLHRWPADRLARLAERISSLEQQLIFGKGPARAQLAEEMLAVARAGRR
ncbi:DNA polymerase III subunit delta [Sphingomicrobium marinum]|uniref:DNA polymerase III subunit delta n=1 Tax=Sphingomicrobium marinum TaxID=1227950 RepID=UPI0022407D2F|nr:DNA polymerase III subunit delta [Sphingomicrobium marinum]